MSLSPAEEPPTTKRIPRVILPAAITNAFISSPGSISPDIAAALAKSLIGHVLFLKGQIVLPIGQLTKMVQRQEQAKEVSAGKAAGKVSKAKKLLESYDLLSTHLASTFQALAWAYARDGRERGDAHLAMLVGPGLSSAKAKLILAINELDIPSRKSAVEADSDDKDLGSEEEEDNGVSEGEDGDDLEPSDGAEEEEEEEEEKTDSEGTEENDADEVEEEEETDNEAEARYAAEQKAIHDADRLLSMTLARTEADGIGMGEDISPTQTHILLHCPRTFDHPAWTPQPNFTPSLNRILQDFHDASLQSINSEPSPNITKPTKKKAKTMVEGVIITTPDAPDPKESTRNEEEDMLWYAWNGGKLVGFSDW